MRKIDIKEPEVLSSEKTAEDLESGIFFIEDDGDLCLKCDEDVVICFGNPSNPVTPWMRAGAVYVGRELPKEAVLTFPGVIE